VVQKIRFIFASSHSGEFLITRTLYGDRASAHVASMPGTSAPAAVMPL
jgi:hypothetical protein